MNFDDITEEELRKLWKKNSDQMIADRYGVTKKEVIAKRKEYKINPATNALYEIIDDKLIFNRAISQMVQYNSKDFPHTNSITKDLNLSNHCNIDDYENGGKRSKMKATGIVRRIDDLGRIVIPKEIRRTLHIRESDPLEIYTDREGQIILKKYSPIGEMTTFAKQYAESLAQVSGHTAVIADRDQFVAVAGGYKQLLNKSVSKQLEDKVNNREFVLASKGDRSFINICGEIDEEYQHQAIAPIICEGDVIGSVVLLQNNNRSKMGEVEQKLVQSAAGFLGRQMEQ